MTVFSVFTVSELYPLTDTILNTVNNVKNTYKWPLLQQSLMEGFQDGHQMWAYLS